MIFRTILIVASVICLVSIPSLQSLGQDADVMRQDQAFEEAFDAAGSLPWYDPATDQVKPVEVKPRLDDSANRDSRRLPKPPKPKQTTPTQANPNNPAPTGGTTPSAWQYILQNFGELIGWVLFGLCVALIVALIVNLMLRMEPGRAEGSEADATAEHRTIEEQARLEQLPVEVRRIQGDLLAEADRLRQAGRYDEAIIYLFGYRLLQLDRAHLIRLARGKTNLQYLRELSGRRELQGIMRETVRLFERSYFGRYEITSSEFATLREQQPAFESLLTTEREAA